MISIPPDFPWRGGMLWHVDGGECPLCCGAAGFRWHEADGSENGETCPCSGRAPDWTPKPWEPRGAVPDPTDGATRGALLDAVRKAWGDPFAYVTRGGGSEEIGVWHVHIDAGSHRVSRRGSTEFDALLAAWAARPDRDGAS